MDEAEPPVRALDASLVAGQSPVDRVGEVARFLDRRRDRPALGWRGRDRERVLLAGRFLPPQREEHELARVVRHRPPALGLQAQRKGVVRLGRDRCDAEAPPPPERDERVAIQKHPRPHQQEHQPVHPHRPRLQVGPDVGRVHEAEDDRDDHSLVEDPPDVVVHAQPREGQRAKHGEQDRDQGELPQVDHPRRLEREQAEAARLQHHQRRVHQQQHRRQHRHSFVEPHDDVEPERPIDRPEPRAQYHLQDQQREAHQRRPLGHLSQEALARGRSEHHHPNQRERGQEHVGGDERRRTRGGIFASLSREHAQFLISSAPGNVVSTHPLTGARASRNTPLRRCRQSCSVALILVRWTILTSGGAFWFPCECPFSNHYFRRGHPAEFAFGARRCYNYQTAADKGRG